MLVARRVSSRRVKCRKRKGAKRHLPFWLFFFLRGLELFCTWMTLFALMTFVVVHGVTWLHSGLVHIECLMPPRHCIRALHWIWPLGARRVLQMMMRIGSLCMFSAQTLRLWKCPRVGFSTKAVSKKPVNLKDFLSQHVSPHAPNFRGGGRQNKQLLEGLTALLQNIDATDDSDDDADEKALYDRLCQLVNRKPVNLLASLRELLADFTPGKQDSTASPASTSDWTVVTRKKGKGKGKHEQKVSETSTVAKGVAKGSGKQRPGPPSKSFAVQTPWKVRSSDWGGAQICHDLDSYLKARDSDKTAKVVVQPLNGSDFEAVVDYLEDAPNKSATIVFQAGLAGSNQNEYVRKNFAKDVVPGLLSGAVVFRQAWVKAASEGAPVRPKRCQLSATKPSAAKTVVLRFYNEQCYHDQSTCAWQRLAQNPGLHARSWSCQIVEAKKLQDTWNWQQITTGHCGKSAAIKGLFRVHLDQASKLLAASGRSLHGMRWFVEVAGKNPDDKLGGQFDNTAVTWQQVEHKENYGHYVERVRALASEMGVIRGYNQLGIRRPACEKDKAADRIVRRMWKTSRTNRGYDFEQIEHVASIAGLQDLEFVDKVPMRGGAVWRFKASGPLNLDNYIATDGDENITLTRQDSRRPSQFVGTALPKESRTRFSAFGPTSKSPSKVAAPADTDGHGPSPARFVDGKSVGQTGGENAPKKHKTDAAALIPELTLKDVPTDGNCLFHAISSALAFHGKESHHLHLRSICIKHLKKHAATYGAFWDGQGPTEDSKPANFSEYLDAVSAPGAWCGYFELAALSNTMDRPIIIAHDAGNFHVFNADGTQPAIALYYNGTCHYQAFVGQIPERVLQDATKPVPLGHRGGAASTVAGRTKHSASSSVGGRTRKAFSVCSESSVGGRTRLKSPSVKASRSASLLVNAN